MACRAGKEATEARQREAIENGADNAVLEQQIVERRLEDEEIDE